MSSVPTASVVPTTACASALYPWFPTYETSNADDQGKAICTPAFHCADDGSLESYQKIVKLDGVRTDAPLGSACSVPYRTVEPCPVGGLPISENAVCPCGRSKKTPTLPRI